MNIEHVRRFARDWAAVVILGTFALLGFAWLGEGVLDHESSSFDVAVQRWMLAHQQPVAHRIFSGITALGGINAMYVVAAAGAVYLWYRRRHTIAAMVLVAPLVADELFRIFKRVFARPRPAGLGGSMDRTYSFPSGHATVSAAVCCALAYVLWREELIHGRSALVLAIVPPLLVGVSRLYLNVHWATDVLGGWSVGLLIAVLSAALYRHYHRRRARGRDARADSQVTPPSTP